MITFGGVEKSNSVYPRLLYRFLFSFSLSFVYFRFALSFRLLFPSRCVCLLASLASIFGSAAARDSVLIMGIREELLHIGLSFPCPTPMHWKLCSCMLTKRALAGSEPAVRRSIAALSIGTVSIGTVFLCKVTFKLFSTFSTFLNFLNLSQLRGVGPDFRRRRRYLPHPGQLSHALWIFHET